MLESVQPMEAKIRLREAEGVSAEKAAVVLRELLCSRLEDAMLDVVRYMGTLGKVVTSKVVGIEEDVRHSDEDMSRRRPRERLFRDFDFLDKAECTLSTDGVIATARRSSQVQSGCHAALGKWTPNLPSRALFAIWLFMLSSRLACLLERMRRHLCSMTRIRRHSFGCRAVSAARQL